MNQNNPVIGIEVEIARKEAYSLKGTSLRMKKIGQTEENGRITIYFRDDNGDYWYEKKFRVNGEIISEEMYIFGRELKNDRKGYKRACY